jgi:serine/threonine protein kinase/WD40 repeat protein
MGAKFPRISRRTEREIVTKDPHLDRSEPTPSEERYRRLVGAARSQFEASATASTRATPSAQAPRRYEPVPELPGYDLAAEIHRGGQGVVYRAQQRSTGRTVAIKFLRAGSFSPSHERVRFEREIHVLGQLNHPNIVGIIDSGIAAGGAYFVMDYIDGRRLDEWVSDWRADRLRTEGPGPVEAVFRSRRGGKSGFGQALQLFIRVCDAVSAAHLRGVIHRDLKPSNVLVDSAGEPHILDFGLAKVVDGQWDLGKSEVTQTGHFMGSLPWASPEQAAGASAQVDVRTDVYSLGVMLYQTLTGRFPYPVSGNVRAVLERIATAEPARPSTVNRAIDDEVSTIVLKCLAKEPERRYQSAGELARDLRHYLNDEPIEAKRDSTWYVLRKTLRRHRMALSVGAGFVALVAASAVLAWVLSVRASRSAAEARAAQQRAVENLHSALIAQAHAIRLSGRAGQRFDALAALAKAAATHPTLELRNEAIAALALTDLRLTRTIERNGSGYFDPDLTRCAVNQGDGAVTIVGMQDSSELARIPPPVTGISQVHLIALNGPWLARVFDPPEGQRRLEVWDVNDRKLALELDDVPFRARFDFSPDGKRLAIGRLDQAIHVYDLNTMQAVQRIEVDRLPSYLTFHPDGRRLVLYHGNFMAAELLDLQTGAREPIFESRAIAWSVAWHPKGRLVAGAALANVELWDTDQRQRVALLAGHEDQIVYLTFSHDGTKLLSHSWDGVTILWDVPSQRPLLRTVLGWPAFSPDDRLIAGTTGTGTTGNQIKLLDVEGDAPRRRLIAWDNVQATAGGTGAFEPRTGLLLMVNQGITGGDLPVLRVYDPQSGHEVARQPLAGLFSLAVEPAGRFMVTAQESGVFRWPLRREQNRLTIGPPDPPCVARGVARPAAQMIAVSADGMTVLTGVLEQGAFTMRDLRSGTTRTLGYGRRASGARISPDGRWVAIGSWYGPGAAVWDAASGERVADLPLAGMSHIEFSPDGAWLATSDVEAVRVWATGTWRQARQSLQIVSLLGFSPDGRLLVAAPDRTRIRLIDFATLEEVATLEPPESYYTTECAFNPDGTLLAQFTNRNGVVHLWDLRQIRAELATIGLDWDHPPYPYSARDTPVPWQVSIDPGPGGLEQP